MSESSTLKDWIDIFTNLGLKIIPFLGVVAFLVFIVGVGSFIRSTGNDKEMQNKKNILIWGVVGMFVLVTMWGIVAFLQNEFGFGNEPGIPQIKLHTTDTNFNPPN